MCAAVWAISVPENILKYAKFSGKFKIQKEKINKLISTVNNTYPYLALVKDVFCEA